MLRVRWTWLQFLENFSLLWACANHLLPYALSVVTNITLCFETILYRMPHARSMRSLMFQMSLVLLLIAAVLTAVDIPDVSIVSAVAVSPILLLASLQLLVISTYLLSHSYWHPRCCWCLPVASNSVVALLMAILSCCCWQSCSCCLPCSFCN